MGELIAFICMMVVGSILFLIMLRIIKSYVNRFTIKVEGTITEIRRSRRYSNDWIDVPIYEYDYNGVHYRTSDAGSVENSYQSKRIGKKVNLLIDPSKPEITFRHRELLHVYFLVGWSAIVSVVGLIGLIVTLVK